MPPRKKQAKKKAQKRKIAGANTGTISESCMLHTLRTLSHISVKTINDLPPGLLAKILLHVRSGEYFRLTKPMLLTCKKWTSTILGTADFWTTIYYEHPESDLDVVKLYLARSQKALLKVIVFCDSIYHLRTLAEALKDNFWRVEAFDFSGDPRAFFPLFLPMPNLRSMGLTLWLPRDSVLSEVPYLVPPSTRLTYLSVDSILPEDHLRNIDPSGMLSVALYRWSPQFVWPFVSLCHGLQHLLLMLNEVDDAEADRLGSLDFPKLRGLRTHGRTNAVGRLFPKLPSLVHLTIAYGRINIASELQSVHFGPMTVPSSAWPVMPNLRTLTVDHADMADLIPTLQSSPLLEAMHLHGNFGFVPLLRYLALDSPHNEPGKIPTPHLKLLRIWAILLSEPEERERVYEYDDADEVMALFLSLLRLRSSLFLEVGVNTLGESSLDPHGGEPWEGQWDLDHLRVITKSDVRAQIRVVDAANTNSHARARVGEPHLPRSFPVV